MKKTVFLSALMLSSVASAYSVSSEDWSFHKKQNERYPYLETSCKSIDGYAKNLRFQIQRLESQDFYIKIELDNPSLPEPMAYQKPYYFKFYADNKLRKNVLFVGERTRTDTLSRVSFDGVFVSAEDQNTLYNQSSIFWILKKGGSFSLSSVELGAYQCSLKGFYASYQEITKFNRK